MVVRQHYQPFPRFVLSQNQNVHYYKGILVERKIQVSTP